MALVAQMPATSGEKLAAAARAQVGITTGYDPAYRSIAYPNGDVPRTTGICADVVVRACRDALGVDLQQLVHADMQRAFHAYPHAWGAAHPDSNIDHRRVLNLQAFWTRQNARVWQGSGAGDEFGAGARAGDFITWLIGGSLPHVGVLVAADAVVHNIGRGTEQTPLAAFHDQHAVGRYRWPG